jgi:hypothetical protein
MHQHRTWGLLRVGVVVATCATGAAAQRVQTNRWGYDFPARYDAEVAAPAVHRVHYADDHIMLMEVANPPGYPMQMHGHPYPSVFARSSGQTHLGGGGPGDQYLEPAGGRNGEHWHSAPAPAGTPALECTAADPQAPHRPVNHGDVPQHFYRIEFKRVDEDAPVALRRLDGPATERKLFEDDVIRLVEVTLPPGRSGATLVAPLPSVLVVDTGRAFDALDGVVGAGAGRALAPTGLVMPRCLTVDSGATLAFKNTGGIVIQYYRMEFKRIEGAALKARWRDWYPFMAGMR